LETFIVFAAYVSGTLGQKLRLSRTADPLLPRIEYLFINPPGFPLEQREKEIPRGNRGRELFYFLCDEPRTGFV
jgi:AAA+ superfamily predicted ATPase